MVNTEHKHAGDAPWRKGQHLSRIFDSAGVVLFYLSVEPDDCFRFLTINQSFMDATGLVKDQIVGRRMEEVIPEPSVLMVRKKYKEAIEKKRIVRWEETSEFPAGVKVGEVSITPFFNDTGVCTHLVGVVHDITEQKRVEEALRKSEALAKAGLNATSDMVYLTDRHGTLLTVNDIAAKRLGKPPHELIGTNVFDYFPDDVAASRKEKNDIVLRSGKPLRFQDERDGSVFDVSIYPTFDEHKNVDRMAVYVTDITERKQAEDELRREKEFTETALDAQLDTFFLFDPETGKALRWNKTFRNISGYSDDEIASLPAPASYYSTDDLKRAIPFKENVMKDGSGTIVLDLICKDGRKISTEYRVSTIYDKDGHPKQIISIGRDITERIKVMEKLNWELRLNTALSSLFRPLGDPNASMAQYAGATLEQARAITGSPHGYASSIDSDTGAMVVHTAAEMPAEEERISMFPAGSDGTYPAFWGTSLNTRRAHFTNAPPEQPDTKQTPFGSIPIRCTLFVPVMLGKELVGQVALANAEQGYTGRDLDAVRKIAGHYALAIQRKRAEEKLRELNDELERRVAERTAEAEKKAEQLGLLARQLTEAEQHERSRISQILHDHIQQLLVAARIHTGMARRLVHKPRTIECLEKALAMIGETLDASRSLAIELSPPILSEAGLVAALQWLARQMADRHELTVHLAADDQDEPEDSETRILLFEAVRELLFNVVKHAETRTAHVKLERSAGKVRIGIRDEGVGFDPSTMHIDDDNRIGLSNIQSRLQLLGGKLDLRSAVGEGTSVTIQLPLRSGPSPADKDIPIPPDDAVGQPQDTTVPNGKIRVLLVDDHQVMREGLVMLLESEPDIEVIAQAPTGERGVELARELNPDVIVMDNSMPGMDGCEATRLIVSDSPERCVIGLSMHANPSVADRMLKAGAAAFITKGGPSEELINTIRSLGQAR